ncbi:MAG: type II toxin-antitoxin system Phd/YefM family antitoxin [Deltaproteobacteria bacterium]|nr:type II toxin-antitoxin system Phd/YefM family antitoxin [Deltaproteobacteria bacterium]
MDKTLTITQARQQLLGLADTLTKQPAVVTVTRRGTNVLVILPIETYEHMQETMAITADAALMASIERGLEDARRGRVKSLKAVRKQLRL